MPGDAAQSRFAPVDFCRETRPSQAANSRPERNSEASATVGTMAVAMSGPTPGDFGEPIADRVGAVPNPNFGIDLFNPLSDLVQLFDQQQDNLATRFGEGILFQMSP